MKNKKTIIYVMAVLILSILFVFQLAACGKTPTPDDDNKEQTTYFMVRFNTNGGTSVKSIKIKKGEAITFPDSPTKEGYIFDGWYLDSSCVEALEEGYLVKNSITLYAKWKEATKPVEDYQVIFYVDGEVYFQATLKSGAVLTLPKTPTKEGYVFDGWYLDSDFLQAVDDNNVIIGNVSIYAKWKTAQASEECEHEPIADKGYSPTCTKQGLSDGTHCDKCGKVLVEQEEIPAIGHSLERHKAKAATCTEIGWEAYDTCKRDGCEYTTYVEIPALNHDIEHHEAKAATCTEIGWEAYDTCKRDGCEYTTYVELPALNHDIEHHEAKAATCTEIGWEAYDTCKRDGCEYTTYVEIPAHNFDENGVCTVCGYFDSGLAFTLNADGESYSVSGIGNFTGTELVIPKVNSDTKPVTSIGNSAFSGCSGLTSIIIPDSVTSIGNFAFEDCNNLQDIYITDIAAWCNISRLGNLMWFGSSNKNLYINNELITSVTIPNGVTEIPSDAFSNCSGLTSIVIPDSVTSIGLGAFSSCSGLESITVAKGNAKYHSSGNCLIETASKTMISGCNTSVIPSDGSVTNIGNGAFFGCSGLTSVTIPDSVTSIGDSAFSSCKGLTSITIPNSVTSIGWGAFYGCTGLTSIVIPDSVTSIGDSAFYNCKGLTSITIPNSVTSIGSWAFAGCTGLTSIVIPDSVTSIGWGAFYGCTGLTSVIFKDTPSWYRTKNYDDWDNKSGGTLTGVTSATDNATYFKTTYKDYYWYKL